MDIYVVQQGDSIYTIADKYNISVDKLILDNGIENANNLIVGQTIVIVYPSQTYTVQEGDTIKSIASSYGITVNQILRNNPSLYGREYIYSGEILVISYNTSRELTTNGFVYPYVSKEILTKTLPYLTFLSVFNYRIGEKGNIISYIDDSEIIQLAKTYGTLPLLMISALTVLGEANIEMIYELLINEEYQEYLINTTMNLLTNKGFSGINIVITNLNTSNQQLYINLITKISNRLNKDGYLLFVTVNPNIKTADNTISFEKIDYKSISQLVYRLTFLQYYWAVNTNPPGPVSSITALRTFMDYVSSITSTQNLSIGKQLIAYDWSLPYIQGETIANSLTLNSAIALAGDTGSHIQFDEPSQTPYFNYYASYTGELINHIVWSIDARSIKAIDDLIVDYQLVGSGIWNLMIYYQQMWTVMISRFDIVKFLPENF
jgi:spore germination protein